MNFLISGVGGATPLSIAKRIRSLYPEATIIGTDLHKNAIGFHLNNLIDFKYVVPSSSKENYWQITHEIITNHKIDYAFIQSEKEVVAWAEYFKSKNKYPCPVLIPPLEFAVNLMDKGKMADLFKDTKYIPKTITFIQNQTPVKNVESEIGFPCWIRASQGAGGYGSLKITSEYELEAWLFINKEIEVFTVSEFLPGKHLANQMMYIDGKCVKNAGLECVEYVMADIALSKVTGNTSYGKLINNDKLLEFCEESMEFLSQKLNVKPHGVFSFDLKLDKAGNFKITEINIRHMAYTSVMADAGFDLLEDTIKYLSNNKQLIDKDTRFKFSNKNMFLRNVDIEPIVLNDSNCYESIRHK